MLEALELKSDQIAAGRFPDLLCSGVWVPGTPTVSWAKWSLSSSTDQLKESSHFNERFLRARICDHVAYSYGLVDLILALEGRYCFYFSFTDDKTELERSSNLLEITHLVNC